MTPRPALRPGRRGLLAAALAAAAAARAAGGPNLQHATRQGQAVGQLEQALLDAQRSQDRTALEQLLSEDFLMIVAQAPDQPVDRDDWLDASLRAGAWDLRDLAVRNVGDVALASFVLVPANGRAAPVPVFVVDAWRRAGSGWLLEQRHAALATGPRNAIPGNVTRPAVRKKI